MKDKRVIIDIIDRTCLLLFVMSITTVTTTISIWLNMSIVTITGTIYGFIIPNIRKDSTDTEDTPTHDTP